MLDNKNDGITDDCTHSIQYNGLCVRCGKDLFFNGDDNPIIAKHHALHSVPGLKVSQQEAIKLENESVSRLMQRKKLSLVIDLDQTILHASVDPTIGTLLSKQPLGFYKDIHVVNLYRPHYIKLRPFFHEFINGDGKLNNLYEMHIYTMGSREYAQSITALIDPDGKFFADRILTRDENEMLHNQKSLKRIFPVNDRNAVVIDDRVDVWGQCENLIQVRPYLFFRGTGDINHVDLNASSPQHQLQKKVSDIDQKFESIEGLLMEDNDDELLVIKKVLVKLHKEFFRASQQFQDIKFILPMIKSNVLRGVHLVFSGVIPLEQHLYESALWKSACEFGAVCCGEVRNGVTHVVTNNISTEKVIAARKIRGVFIISLQWLIDSIRKWERQDEHKYLLIEPLPNISENEEQQTDDYFFQQAKRKLSCDSLETNDFNENDLSEETNNSSSDISSEADGDFAKSLEDDLL